MILHAPSLHAALVSAVSGGGTVTPAAVSSQPRGRKLLVTFARSEQNAITAEIANRMRRIGRADNNQPGLRRLTVFSRQLSERRNFHLRCGGVVTHDRVFADRDVDSITAFFGQSIAERFGKRHVHGAAKLFCQILG